MKPMFWWRPGAAVRPDLSRKLLRVVEQAHRWKAGFMRALLFAVASLLVASILAACGGGQSAAPVVVPREKLQLKTPLATPTPVQVAATYSLPAAIPFDFLGITSGPDGNVWVSECTPHVIARITPTGTVTEFTTLTANACPTEIAPGPDGNLWFSEFGTNSIGRITTTGVVTEFPLPAGLFPPSVADPGPRGMVKGPDGNLWFGHNAANVIGVMSPSGSILATHAIPTANSGPVRIANGPDGNMWFVELFANKIGRINTVTGTIDEFAVPTASSDTTGNPADIHAGSDGNMWFTERAVSQVARITMSGVITEFVTPFPLSRPQMITSTPDGSLWFGEAWNNAIARVNPANLTVVDYVLPGIHFLRGITAGQGNTTVWVTDEVNGTVHKVSEPPASPLRLR